MMIDRASSLRSLESPVTLGRVLTLGVRLIGWLPRGVSTRLAAGIGDLYGRLPTGRRRVVETNLARMAPHRSAAERGPLVRATFRHRALSWVDLLRLPSSGPAALRELVDCPDRPRLDEALATGRGALLVGPHLGGLELAGAYLAALGYPVTSVAEDIAADLDAVMRALREATGMRVLSRRDGAVGAHRALERGEVLAVVADRLIGGRGLTVPFGTGHRRVPIGPARFALRRRAPLIVGALVHQADGIRPYRMICEAVVAPEGTVEDLTGRLAAAMARLVERHPDQWYVFQDEWLDPAPETPAAREEALLSSEGRVS